MEEMKWKNSLFGNEICFVVFEWTSSISKNDIVLITVMLYNGKRTKNNSFVCPVVIFYLSLDLDNIDIPSTLLITLSFGNSMLHYSILFGCYVLMLILILLWFP